MKERLYSSSWYRVSDLRPRLRSHARIHRHHYRGELWYVLQDPANEKYFRFTPAAYSMIGFMDGKRTVQEIWNLASEKLGDEGPTQDQVIQLLGQLHSADVLQCDVPPDTEELLKRYTKARRQKWLQQLMSPLFWRFPLFDPERLLVKMAPLVRPLFTTAAMAVWFMVVALGAALIVMNWQDLSENVIDRVLAPENLILLWLTFPVLKLLHEFGHACAVKAYGGEVHEMGLMLLVLTPLPYVDASAASAYRNKRQRIIVSSAGMMVELFVASLALMLWLNLEPGTVLRTVLYNVIFIASVSTVLFNANPLLRFDGYYILADLIEIPNLRARSYKYLGYLFERYLFGRKDAEVPPCTRGEKGWFLFFSIASFFYRIIIFTGIILFIASRFFFIGVALAIWGLIAWGIFPLVKTVKHVLTSPKLRKVRGRAVLATATVAAVLISLISVVPAPLRTRADGVVWIPEEAIVRAESDGFVVKVEAQPGSRVNPGDVLFVCEDPTITAQVKFLEAKLRELYARRSEVYRDRVETAMVDKDILLIEERLARERERLEDLVVRSDVAGTLVVAQAEDLPGRFVKQGTVLAQVLNRRSVTAKLVIPQEDLQLIQRTHTPGAKEGIHVRLAEDLDATISAKLLRWVPALDNRLPSPALGHSAGGGIATDPADQEGVKTVQRYFHMELELPNDRGINNVGSRVFVRFDHGWEPLAKRWYRSLRRLFLSRFNV